MIEVRNLTVEFKRQVKLLGRLWGQPDGVVRAVDDVSLHIGRGEILGLVGENGCGKTTLARAMLCLCQATAGKIIFDGQDLSLLDSQSLKRLRRRMQILFQDSNSALDPRFSVLESLKEPLVVHGFSTWEINRRVRGALDRVGLTKSLLPRRPVELSGGQRQRVCLARALVLEPEFLVLDEPLAGLDVSVGAQLLKLLMELRSELGLSYLFISHDLGSTLYASDRIAVMRQGRIVEYLDPDRYPAGVEHPYTLELFSYLERTPILAHRPSDKEKQAPTIYR
ncbi:MAG: ATP-binding cassette domain-containing protein [Chloroflexota bacterium]|jgi:ABC-type glutathione transport system ATPase component